MERHSGLELDNIQTISKDRLLKYLGSLDAATCELSGASSSSPSASKMSSDSGSGHDPVRNRSGIRPEQTDGLLPAGSRGDAGRARPDAWAARRPGRTGGAAESVPAFGDSQVEACGPCGLRTGTWAACGLGGRSRRRSRITPTSHPPKRRERQLLCRAGHVVQSGASGCRMVTCRTDPHVRACRFHFISRDASRSSRSLAG